MVPAGARGLAGEGPRPGRGHRQLRCPARLRPGHARGVWSWTMPPRVRASRGFPGRHEGGGPGAPPLCRSEQQGCRFGFTWLVRCWSQARSQVRRGRRCGAVAGAARPSAVVRRALCVVRRMSGGCRVLWGGGGDPVSARPSSACSPAGATLSTRLWTLGTSTPWFGHPLPLRFFTGRHLRSLVKREFGEFFHLR